jgi:hypothetical protein
MRIKGYFNPDFKPPVPFIEVVVFSEEVGFKHEVRLLLDTGASMRLVRLGSGELRKISN